MARVLVVEDSPTQALAIRGMLEGAGYEVRAAGNGVEALQAMAAELPDLVLTDLQMPEMNGLELVEAIRERYPLVPSVLMTAQGSEEIAIQALQKGAASYVPKRNLSQSLLETLGGVLAQVQTGRSQQRLGECLLSSSANYVLDNDCTLIPQLVESLRRTFADLLQCDETETVRLGIALEEALLNALYYGNLEVRSDLAVTNPRAYHELVEERLRTAPYRNRRIHVRAKAARDEVECVIRDEGPGFDPTHLTVVGGTADLEDLTSRSRLLIQTFMDDVEYNEAGNEITLRKRRDS